MTQPQATQSRTQTVKWQGKFPIVFACAVTLSVHLKTGSCAKFVLLCCGEYQLYPRFGYPRIVPSPNADLAIGCCFLLKSRQTETREGLARQN
jgi:hypothetical protein